MFSVLWIILCCGIWKFLIHWFLDWHVGTSVVQVTATDADDPTYGNSARVVYSILQGQPYFSVEPKTGKHWNVTLLIMSSHVSWHRVSISYFYLIRLMLIIDAAWLLSFSQYVNCGDKHIIYWGINIFQEYFIRFIRTSTKFKVFCVKKVFRLLSPNCIRKYYWHHFLFVSL